MPACQGDRGCPIPQPDAEGVRALGIRARLCALPANVAGGWMLERLGASLWEIEMIGVIEAAIEERRGNG